MIPGAAWSTSFHQADGPTFAPTGTEAHLVELRSTAGSCFGRFMSWSSMAMVAPLPGRRSLVEHPPAAARRAAIGMNIGLASPSELLSGRRPSQGTVSSFERLREPRPLARLADSDRRNVAYVHGQPMFNQGLFHSMLRVEEPHDDIPTIRLRPTQRTFLGEHAVQL
jgi:hypothetical protein